ncbi:MAG: HigA family addiction module antitoxin [Pseudomonadota bacterium]
MKDETPKKLKIGMKPPHPGAFIRDEIMNELSLPITKMAEILHVRRATLSDLINEKSSLSPEMAMRLELAFHVKTETLLNMQAWYDAATIRERAKDLGVDPYVP